MSKRTLKLRPARRDKNGLPTRESSALRKMGEADRRRFLKQLAAGAGVFSLGLPRLSHGQSVEVNFGKLCDHPPVGPAGKPLPSKETPAVELTENRALWVTPGYLVLVRWRRHEDDDAVVAAFEGSADAVSTFLTTRVTSVDHIHNLDQLHGLESDLMAMLAARVSPAQIDVLHLDHDCTVVCSALNPSTEYPENIEVMGDWAGPGWH